MYALETEAEVSRDILEKAPFEFITELSEDAQNVRPEVARIVFALSLSRMGKRLTRVSGKHGVDAAPRSCVEGFDIVPDWRGRDVSGALPCNEAVAGVGVPFDVAGGGKARLGKLKTHVKSAAA